MKKPFTRRRAFELLSISVLASLAGIVLWRILLHTGRLDDGFMPHGHCYLWKPGILWLHVISDAVIGSSYVAISGTLAYLVSKGRKDLPFHWMMLAFATFIVACGGTHIMEVITVWRPFYWLSGEVKLVTAIASLLTAMLLPPLIPKVLALLESARLSTERKLALESALSELALAYEKIKGIDLLKSAFFANVSHELRTPLALIFGPVDKLLSEPGMNEGQQKQLNTVRRNALLLHKHVNELLDLSKLEAGKLELEYARIDLARLFRLVAAYFDTVTAERAIQLTVDTPDELYAEVDSEKVQRIFLNLLSNALKFTPEGGQIECTLRLNEDGTATAALEDSGPGVPEGLRETIFERFAQGESGPSRRFGGTGLGLSIVKEFALLHKGTVSVGESSLGGARFEFRLPLKAPPGTPVVDATAEFAYGEGLAVMNIESVLAETKQMVRSENQPDVEMLSSERAAKPLILVADDNFEMGAFISGTLESDYRVITARSGDEAVKLAAAEIPDLIISDVMMPGMTGPELLACLRNDPDLAGIPVVLLSAKADEELKNELLRTGAQDYITKPFAVDELRARVQNQISAKKARDTLQELLQSQDQDISRLATEVTRRTEDLKMAKEAAEQANRAKDRFLAILSHELRTPLMPVLTGVLELEADTQLQKDARSVLSVIRRNVELEARLIDDLLDLTRVSRGKLQIHPEPVNAHEVLKTAVNHFKAQITGKGLQMNVQLSASRCWVEADAPRMLQVFTNLLGNAIKFTPPEGRIEVITANNDGQIEITISDSGIGVSPEGLLKIFKPFEQAHEGITRQYGGLGLGLAVCKTLVEAHAGTISASSEGLGCGTSFTVTLSTIEAPSPAAGSAMSAEAPRIPRRLRILLVEDHEDTRAVLTRLIKRWGYDVEVAGSVGEAIKLGSSKPFDLIISDFGLPDGSGADVVRNLRENSPIPAIAISGFGMDEDVRRSLDAGFTQHLTKPVAAGQLKAVIEEATMAQLN